MYWCTGTNYVYQYTSTLKNFSQAYCSFLLFPVLAYITSKKDLGIFMQIGSFGVIFIIFLMIYIIYVGIVAFTNTEFEIGSAAQADNTNWNDNLRTLVMFNLNFAPLAGDLCTGYFLHTCSLPVLRSAKQPEKNNRDLFLGYLLVWISYCVVGMFGYIGFVGFNFREYFLNEQNDPLSGQINQNCLLMFNYQQISAFFLRIFVFILLFSTYPLVQFFLTSMLLLLFWSKREITRREEIILNMVIILIPVFFTLVYPNIGTILGYVGAFTGFVIMYLLPVMVHLKRMKTRIQNPLLAEAIDMNAFRLDAAGTQRKGEVLSSPKITLNDEFMKRRRLRVEESLHQQRQADMNRYYTQCVLHSFIPVYGFLILFFQFYKFQ